MVLFLLVVVFFPLSLNDMGGFLFGFFFNLGAI